MAVALLSYCFKKTCVNLTPPARFLWEVTFLRHVGASRWFQCVVVLAMLYEFYYAVYGFPRCMYHYCAEFLLTLFSFVLSGRFYKLKTCK